MIRLFIAWFGVPLTTAESASTNAHMPHIILDAGSTGTRLYVFWHNMHVTGEPEIVITSEQVGRVKPGLSSFEKDEDLDKVADLFKKAAALIPEVQRKEVLVWFMGTAGMRATHATRQADIWKKVLQHEGFHLFHNITAQTISGQSEGLYSLTCVNFLAAQEKTMKDSGPYGIIDLGGSSTQIAKPPANVGDELFVRSFSDAGMDVSYEKLGNRTEACYYKGYKVGNVVGAGNATACREVIQDIIGPTLESRIRNASVATSPNTHYVAVSGYDYVVDFIDWRIGLDGFPRSASPLESSDEACSAPKSNAKSPTIRELERRVNELCATEWSEIEKASLENPHVYTRTVAKASLRCFESNYALTLLRWYGFKEDESRITFIDEINGNSVEWPLGALVHHFRGDRPIWCSGNSCDNTTAPRDKTRDTVSGLRPSTLFQLEIE
eukprot:GEMP01018446.1.p1 GENE.GEMP01018446.1~~GEMP01018446.1.p1  ORF type:complete len:439 (+),score=74.33 GEMP01018446.1:197-1513(+)